MSNRLGSHQTLFNQGTGLTEQATAPNHPPRIEIVAPGFLRLIHEQTVILLKTITPVARANNRHVINQRKCGPISNERTHTLRFLVCKSPKPSSLALEGVERT